MLLNELTDQKTGSRTSCGSADVSRELSECEQGMKRMDSKREEGERKRETTYKHQLNIEH